LGWIDLPVNYDKEEFDRIKQTAKKIKEDSDVLLVVGIGGSYLGARAAIEFLSHSFYNCLDKSQRKTPQIIFCGNSISSKYIADTEPKVKDVFISISKAFLRSLSFWLSISDLMSSILIIFILLFVYKTINSIKAERLKENIIREITDTKENIIGKLKTDLANKNIQVDIDDKTGTIKIDEKILFEVDQYTLKPEGKEFLERVIPLYLKIFTENKNFMSRLDQIIIEGHSDDMGSYLYNMDLSQKRANEVFKYIYTTLGNFSKSEREELEKYITANGKSKANLIYKENGEVDRAKSRRVEIKFKLKDEEALNKIKKTLE